MKTTVIVSTYNSPAWLEKVLTGYACQDILRSGAEEFELIVADDGSTGETRELVGRLGATSPFHLRHVWHEDNGFRKCSILNRAIESATGDYLVFTDGDCVPRPDFLAIHRARAAPGRFLSGGYCRLPMATSLAMTPDDIRAGRAFEIGWLRRNGYGPSLKWVKILARPWGLDGLLNALTPARDTFNGNNSSCWRADALRVGGFDERMGYGGEDREFGYRLENAGISAKMIRYSALCLHLDHKRGYKHPQARAANEAIIAETRASKATRTAHGIAPTEDR